MRLAVTTFATDLTTPIPELAREVEARGFSGLYLPEHTHIPVSRRTPPAAGQQTLPEDYSRTLDPLVALSFAAAVTSRITLGTGILLAAQRDPIVTAKAIATLDHLSGGRVSLGVGFGWNVEEIENHGVPFADRRAVGREHVLAMRALWERDEAGFDGAHVAFEPSWSWPKPVGRVPIYLGGAAGPGLFAQIAEYADGWMPFGGKGVGKALPALAEACAERGRPIASVIPFGSYPDPGKLEYFASLGIEEVILHVPADRDVRATLDDYARYL
ncbi:LLM class F420-dependent oxidoreductase [Acrocarpospora corrugata]|uniref:LLM class F420-dependent oxidoreductase n=1 Tax=Acrocarpospora corrugata TaxID=35763 RepID=A0A5M3W7Z6_9ACTN|nr:LLM class F420-dependent oxidoreductase [Acrocarpospora corrugata]GES04936.1 LLM class F420-dependent oxidoreductase [Acrocarpospora corrugata]